MIKVINSIDAPSLLSEYLKIQDNICWSDYGHKGRQAGIQHKPGDDPWTSAVGRRQDGELKYTDLNPYFRDTEFEKIVQRYSLVRTRLMWVYPFACYSMHLDEYPRVHIPLITNPACYFVFNDTTVGQKIQHLPEGQVYWVDTTKTHTFMNCSEHARLHLVGVVER
jgi:hypothetical protein